MPRPSSPVCAKASAVRTFSLDQPLFLDWTQPTASPHRSRPLNSIGLVHRRLQHVRSVTPAATPGQDALPADDQSIPKALVLPSTLIFKHLGRTPARSRSSRDANVAADAAWKDLKGSQAEMEVNTLFFRGRRRSATYRELHHPACFEELPHIAAPHVEVAQFAVTVAAVPVGPPGREEPRTAGMRCHCLAHPAGTRAENTSIPRSPAAIMRGRSASTWRRGGCAHTAIPPASSIDPITCSGVGDSTRTWAGHFAPIWRSKASETLVAWPARTRAWARWGRV